MAATTRKIDRRNKRIRAMRLKEGPHSCSSSRLCLNLSGRARLHSNLLNRTARLAKPMAVLLYILALVPYSCL